MKGLAILKCAARGLFGEALYVRAWEAKQRARKWYRLLRGLEPRCLIQVCCPQENHGYWICPTGLGRASIIYSFGVGFDLGFELSLIRKFGAQLYVFDPTPAAGAWIKKQSLPPEFHFLKYGIAARDGVAKFYAPRDEANPSWSVQEPAHGGRPAVEAPVRRLSTLMNMLGHDHIDVLKLDIEGAEYEVILDWLAEGIPVGQLAVEFHHRIAGVGVKKTVEAMEALNRGGYRLFHVSRTEPEYSFIRVQALDEPRGRLPLISDGLK